MPITIFSYDRYRLKTDTDIFINIDADTDMIETDTDISVSVSANRYIGLTLTHQKFSFRGLIWLSEVLAFDSQMVF